MLLKNLQFFQFFYTLRGDKSFYFFTTGGAESK